MHDLAKRTGMIEEYIPRGRENAVTRRELAQRTGLADRENRALIEAARLRGVQIVSSSGRPGYYIAEDDSEWLAFLWEQRRRGLAAIRMWNQGSRSVRAWPAGSRVVHVREHVRRLGPAGCPEQVEMEDV